MLHASHKKPLSLLSSCAGTTFNVDGTTAEAAKFGYYITKEQKSLSKLILNKLKTLDSTLKEEKRLNNNFRSGQLFYSIYCMHKLTIFVPLRKQWFSKKLPVERCQLQVSNLERRMSLRWWKKKTNKQSKIINKQLMDNKKHITAFYIILLFFSQNRIRFIWIL